MIALVLEMCGIPSLAFAVGVYLPLSSSAPIFIGGVVRWLVDKYTARKLADRKLTPEQLAAEGDKSPGVLMASGYIAGGAIAGVVVRVSELERRHSQSAEEHRKVVRDQQSVLHGELSGLRRQVSVLGPLGPAAVRRAHGAALPGRP